MLPDDYLVPPSPEATPSMAYATHAARAFGLARYYAYKNPLSGIISRTAGENETIVLLAHLHAASVDSSFRSPGENPSGFLAPTILESLNRGAGLVGTSRDYDMALKGLMTIVYRYRDLLSPTEGVHYIRDVLVPQDTIFISNDHSAFQLPINGPIPASIGLTTQGLALGVYDDLPETENHLFMIESSRYLENQLLQEINPEPNFDNKTNGLWLKQFMQTIAQHDFLEFNARPYARLSIHALLNLFEFAKDPEVSTGARILLDYTMVKFALSSNRLKSVRPFRRKQPRINHQSGGLNDLFSNSADQVAAYFAAYVGATDHTGAPVPIPDSLVMEALIAGTSSYRPPAAAYEIALGDANPPAFHRFYHGTRPQLPKSPDIAEGGLELYYKSPSFLISAGGVDLNSGYGNDELGIGPLTAYEQTSRAQATTLIPTRIDDNVTFADLIRFEAYPDDFINDPLRANKDDGVTIRPIGVNQGVLRGFAAGANLRPAEGITTGQHSPWTPSLTRRPGGMVMSWTGLDGQLNVGANLNTTCMFGIDGVESLTGVSTSSEPSEARPAVACLENRLFIAWKGSGNDNLNLAFSEDNGKTFGGKTTLDESSKHEPALVVIDHTIFLGWTGVDEAVNIAQVALEGNTAGNIGFKIEAKTVLGDTSGDAPALASLDSTLFIAWKGSGNDNLNLASSADKGQTFSGKTVFNELSPDAPALAVHKNTLFLGWSGKPDGAVNIARVALLGNTAGGLAFELENKVTLGSFAIDTPALASDDTYLYVTFPVNGEELVVVISRDGAFVPSGPWIFCDLTELGFYVAMYRTVPDPNSSFPADVRQPYGLGFIYAIEAETAVAHGLPFDAFKASAIKQNTGLPRFLSYGEGYTFHAPGGESFEFLLSSIDNKYSARVTDPSRPNDSSDLSTLPLADGPWLSAPGGHDGLIEIRYQGCQTPVVLDFRDALHPVCTDNHDQCPQPVIDRAKAITQLVQQQDVANQGLAAATMRWFSPPASVAFEYWALFAQVAISRAGQLFSAGDPTSLALLPGATQEAVVTCSTAALAGVGALGLAIQLEALTTKFAGPQGVLAVDMAHAGIDILSAATPAAGTEGQFHWIFGSLYQLCVGQLLITGGDVAGTVESAIDQYRAAAAAAYSPVDLANQLLALAAQLLPTHPLQAAEAALAAKQV